MEGVGPAEELCGRVMDRLIGGDSTQDDFALLIIQRTGVLPRSSVELLGRLSGSLRRRFHRRRGHDQAVVTTNQGFAGCLRR
jgi:hypothetical protein